MSTEQLQPINQYYFGGTLSVDATTYVMRQADLDLYKGLKAGDFCYILNSRQMGKSSLAVRTMTRLKAEGIACAFVDITEIIDKNITEKQWYAGLIKTLLEQFEISTDLNLRNWLKERDFLSSVQCFSEFIETIVLAIPDRKFVVFFDEIDSIIELGSIADSFFAYIRSCWNERAINPKYSRLTFAVLGVAAPSDLMQNRQRTPFNIGLAIEMSGFRLEEAYPLAQGLAGKVGDPQAFLSKVIEWTGGQPFLTQKLLGLVLREIEVNHPDLSADNMSVWLGKIVKDRIIENWEAQDEPEHFKTLKNRMSKSDGQTLGLYQQILDKGSIKANESYEQVQLRLTGLVVKREGQLQVYNPVYAKVFNQEWVASALKALRPDLYAVAFQAWEKEGKTQNESFLLRGEPLRVAKEWVEGNPVSQDDKLFLSFSQQLELKDEKKRTKIAEEEKAIMEKVRQEAVQIATQATQHEKQASQRAEQATQREKQAVQNADQASQREEKAKKGAKLILMVTAILLFVAGWVGKVYLDTVKAQVDVLQSEADFLAGKEIIGLVKGIRAGRKLQQLKVLLSGSSDENTTKVRKVLSRVHTIKESNILSIKESNIPKIEQISVKSVNFSLDGKTLVSGGSDGTIKLWKTDGTLINTIKSEQSSVRSVNFSPDGKTLVSGGNDGTIKLWKRDGTLINTIKSGTRIINSVNFSPDPDGKTLASGGVSSRLDDKNPDTVKAWKRKLNYIVPEPKFAIQGKFEGSIINSVNFSPDGRTLVSGGSDGNLNLWNLDGKSEPGFPIKTEQSSVNSVSFSPDGKTLVSGGSDGTVKFWELNGNRMAQKSWPPDVSLRRTIIIEQSNVNSVNFSPDGEILASAGDDGTIKLWKWKHDDTPKDQLSIEKLLELSCEWAKDYLHTNPNVTNEDRALCPPIPH